MSRWFCTCGSIEGRGRLAMMVTGFALALLAGSAGPAQARSDTLRLDGVTLRLVALPPTADGEMRGALSIELEPGWKTYWIAPGPVGLAPQLDFSTSDDIAQATVALPPPIRFAEGDTQSIGYDELVVLPVHAEATGSAPVLRLDAVLGVCRELCVPVQATLEAEPSSRLSDRALVARAESAIPTETGPWKPSAATWNADRSALRLTLPASPGEKALDAFVAAGEGWSFGAPILQADGAGTAYVLPVLSRPSSEADLESVDVLLTAGEIAQLSRAVPITRQ